jgi:hypothetical protein
LNDPSFWPSLAACVVLLIPLALCCRKASRFSHATEAVLREHGAKLMAELRRPAASEEPAWR